MTTRAQIIAEAREWIGTPFRHQGHMKGVATDCAGFIGGVCVNAGVFTLDFWQSESAEFLAYGRIPARGLLEHVCQRFLIPIPVESARSGDVLLMRFTGEPQHLGFVGDYPHGGLSLIHSWSRARPGGVVEHRLDEAWRSNVVEAFALPGVS